jgi:hypothetical protein
VIRHTEMPTVLALSPLFVSTPFPADSRLTASKLASTALLLSKSQSRNAGITFI